MLNIDNKIFLLTTLHIAVAQEKVTFVFAIKIT